MRRCCTGLCMAVVALLMVAACSKGGAGGDDGNGGGGPHIVNTQDTVPPVVEILTPLPDQAFSSGAVINVTGKVTDDNGLYQGSIRITNDANGHLLKEQLYVIHGITQYNFNISHGMTVSTVTNCTVTVIFEDHGLNTVTKTVKLKVNP